MEPTIAKVRELRELDEDVAWLKQVAGGGSMTDPKVATWAANMQVAIRRRMTEIFDEVVA